MLEAPDKVGLVDPRDQRRLGGDGSLEAGAEPPLAEARQRLQPERGGRREAAAAVANSVLHSSHKSS